MNEPPEVKATGDPRLDALVARIAAKAAEGEARKAAEAEIEPQSGPESAPSDSPRSKGRVESAENVPEAPEVRGEKRTDPILPVVIERVEEPPEREAGRLAFGGIVEGRKSLPAQLPLLPRPEGPRVRLLELSDYRGVPTMARGRGAPLDLRLAVAACLLTPHTARAERARLVVTVRELRDFLFPNGWERRRDWPRIREALFRARDYVIPGPFVLDGLRLGNWLPFALRSEPGEDAGIDEHVVIDVEYPPGSSGHGPVIDRREVSALGVVSGPKFRAYIAAHSVAWLPGVTRRPHPRNPHLHLWSTNPADYPVLIRADRRRLAFGVKDKGNRTQAEQDAAWEDLPGCKIVTRTAATADGRRGWLVLPKAAANAVEGQDDPDG